ncbi:MULTISPECIES: ABC transporter substrate-binding protein [unclassified Streptomyces]|uniref:ABC transporter substrate-binding protein n=1 Tax=unclassified Streptomyces TaxID=2593676 RepID=UPI001BE9AF1D|nr:MULTISPECIES: ABC transporter substrate-binding protein [unclassified Streptomyces]MBT2405020.1 ABC transporter substrate-binding protein [Streptomyces sp. ISL-21]MBT2457008.1 ABC transporter substrate-binding protein [Streptomyces sp. ISL-86]MBT2610746.1 ABC transporter substrate-binding protein [Streptomyces sp. ISL-87]
MRKSVQRSTMFLGAAALVMTAFSGNAGASAVAAPGDDDELRLGYVLPETGQLAFLGPPMIESLKYAVKTINDNGGVLGKPIPAVVSGDEAGQEAVAAQSADRVLARGVDAIIGAAASGMSLAIIDRVTGAGVAQCSGSNTAPTFTDYDDGGYYFRTAPSDALQGPVLAKVVQEDGKKRVALVARADDYGRGLLESTKKALEDKGVDVVLADTYDAKATNFDQVVQKVRNAKPDAAVVISFEEGAQILQGLIEAGLGPKQIGIYGADGLHSAELATLVAPGDPSRIAGMKGTAPASATNEKFVKELKAFAPKLTELQFAPQTFDCVTVLALAAEKAKSDDPEKFTKEIVGITRDGEKCDSFAACKKLLAEGKDIDYDGVSGPLDFTEQGEPGQATIEVYTYDQNGKLQTVRTEVATGE